MTKILTTVGLLVLLTSGVASSQENPRQLLARLQQEPRVESVLNALPQIDAWNRDEDMAFEALPVVEQSISILLSNPDNSVWPIPAKLLKAAARLRAEQAEVEQAVAHLQTLRKLYQQPRMNLPAELAAAQRRRYELEIVLEYLHLDQVDAALGVLGDVVDAAAAVPASGSEMESAVAGALHRRLEAATTNGRYELLYAWTMPAAERAHVRCFSSLASVDGPPGVFARALGERPRTDAFPVPAVGGVSGLFSTGWTLAVAAAESGRLRRLITELEERVAGQTPGAESLLMLARLADSSMSADSLLTELESKLTAVEKADDSAAILDQESLLDWTILGAACLSRAELRQTAERILRTIQERVAAGSTRQFLPVLRRACAIAVLQQHPDADQRLLESPSLKLWVAASEERPAQSAAGAVREIWLAHEEHLLHLAGPHNDYLCFKYPLSGEFEFQVEAQNGGREATFGNLAYGGLAYGVAGNADEFRVWGLDMGKMLSRPFPFVRQESWPTYQRLTLRATANGVEHWVNGRTVWKDTTPTATSPWLALRCFGDYIPAFRDFQLIGEPTIPREVRLTDGNLLRGWFTQFYPTVVDRSVPLAADSPATRVAVNVPPAAEAATAESKETEFDWALRDGILHGAHRPQLLETVAPSRLSYFRPLLDEESIEYEFFYEPEKFHVHPSLGRLAFLLEPGGVRIRWLTHVEAEWTGLRENNATIEPLNRRGPRPLPLKANDWNRVTMRLTSDTLTLELNGSEIYVRQMEADNSRRFGFYHDRNQSAVKIRNAVLRGDWPERLDPEQRKQLLAPRERVGNRSAAASAPGLGQVFREHHIPDSALAVLRVASRLSVTERYDRLASYVLPNDTHRELRVAIDFTPTHPPPILSGMEDDSSAQGEALEPRQPCQQIGGELVSPLFDLVAAARELGQLDELRQQVAGAAAVTELDRRSQLAALILIDLERRDFAAANELLAEMFRLVEAGQQTRFAERWPESLAAFAALQVPETRTAGRELVVYLHLRQARNGADSGSEAWRRQIASWVGLARFLEEFAPSDARQFPRAATLAQWTPVQIHTAQSRGLGYPCAHWHWDGKVADLLSRHHDDFLYFQSPLTGNFELECDLPAFGWRDTQGMVAGEWIAARYDLKSYWRGNFRRFLGSVAVDPPLVKPDEWIRYRFVVRDGSVKCFANGRLLRETAIPAGADPWVAFRSNTTGHGAVKNVCLTGQPVIPEEIALVPTPDFAMWVPYYPEQRVGVAGGDWNWEAAGDEGELVGRRHPELAGLFAESLLRYHRPLLEDGVLDYEFFYRPGEVHCYPALDRLVFVLDPDGVRIHWATDGRFERTGLAADNLHDEPSARRGASPLPLVKNEWNRLSLRLRGDTVQLVLNGEPVYERPLEPSNQRTFGIFHYADATEARVRKLIWRGEWPRELPALSKQELVGETPWQLDDVANLSAVFTHDFAQDGFPSHKFVVQYGGAETFHPESQGLQVSHQGKAGYQNATFAPRLRISGDFDVTVSYENLDTVSAIDGSTSIFLFAGLHDSRRTECLLMRRHVQKKRGPVEQFYQTALNWQDATEIRRNFSRTTPTETRSGTLRLARRGPKVYYLFADGDSKVFQVARVDELSADEIQEGDLRITGQTNGPGKLNVVWKTLAIRAESLAGPALVDQQEVVAQLDEQRRARPPRLRVDFSRSPLSPDQFTFWNLQPAAVPSQQGFVVKGPPSDEWASAGAAPMVPLRGDFDVSFDFDVLRMTDPKPGLHSNVYLQLEIPDAASRQYNLTLVGLPGGERYISAQLRERTADGTTSYPSVGREFVERVERLRLARRGGELFFLYASDRTQPDRLLARHPITTAEIPAGMLRVLIHAGGTGRITETAWRELAIW